MSRFRKIAHYAPFPVHIYRDFLSGALGQKGKLFVRHDIDWVSCAHNMGMLLEVDRELGIPSTMYVRADEKEYLLADHRDQIRACHQDNVEVGLHTVCYLQDDYMTEFQRETDLFSQALGFRPRSFTVHGMGSHRMLERLKFIKEIDGRLGEFGYAFSDCLPRLRSYDRVIHDCHWSEKNHSRFIYEEWIDPPPIDAGGNCLLLTHPGYWE